MPHAVGLDAVRSKSRVPAWRSRETVCVYALGEIDRGSRDENTN
jgi:hypothetical protein